MDVNKGGEGESAYANKYAYFYTLFDAEFSSVRCQDRWSDRLCMKLTGTISTFVMSCVAPKPLSGITTSR